MTSYPYEDKALEKIENGFSYHKPLEGQQDRYTELREKAKELAKLYLLNCPPSREQSVAITELETSLMWAIKAIAINEKE